MKTVTLQIGNSDDKLTQAEWSSFVFAMRDAVIRSMHQMHFSGTSPSDAVWQNACFVFEIHDGNIPRLYELAIECRRKFRQESVAISIGDTMLV